MKKFITLASAIAASSLGAAAPVQASYQWPSMSFYPPRAETVETRGQIPKFPPSIPEFMRVPGHDFWNKPAKERGQVRTYGDGLWQGIHKFPNTQNGCHNGVFLLRWRAVNGPVRSALGWSPSHAEFKAKRAGSYGFMYGTNCQQPLFQSTENNRINNVVYEVIFFQAGV